MIKTFIMKIDEKFYLIQYVKYLIKLEQFKNLIKKHSNVITFRSHKFKFSSLSDAPKISLKEGEGFLPVRSEQSQNKKTLILDLDETLVHSSFKPPDQPDIVLPVEIEGKICYVYVLVRPGAISFLEELAQYYELVIFTASLSKYAEPLM